MKITNIKSYQIEGKLKEPFWWGNGGNDKRSASIVKIETDEGIDGWGEGWGGINEFKDILKVAVIDQDPFEREKIWANMFNELNNPLIYPGLGGSSMSAIDIALWDITGKKLGVPISVLLGGKVKDRVHVYATGLYYTKEDFKEEVSERIKEAISYEKKGFNAMKIKIGAFELEKDLERVSNKLKNSKFLESAPEEVIEREKRICSQAEIAKENIENILNPVSYTHLTLPTNREV